MQRVQHSPELVEALLDALRRYIISKRDVPRDFELHHRNYKLVVEAYKGIRPPPLGPIRLGRLTRIKAEPRIVVETNAGEGRPWWLDRDD